MGKIRKFFITTNNWKPSHWDMAKKLGDEAEYTIRAQEVGLKKGTPHMHVWLRFKNPRSWDEMVKAFPASDVQIGKGHDKDQSYLKKTEEEGGIHWEEQGTMQKGQGARTDSARSKEIALATNSMKTVIQECNSYQAIRMAEVVLKYAEPARPYGPRKVFWYWGATGTGKSYTVETKYADVFKPTSYKWWEGYDGDKVVLLDDIRGDFCKFHEMLKMTGEGGFRVETKGGSRQAVYDTIYITSHVHPLDMWESVEDKSQLIDRITEIREFKGESYRKKRKKDLWNRSTGTEVGGNNSPDIDVENFNTDVFSLGGKKKEL